MKNEQWYMPEKRTGITSPVFAKELVAMNKLQVRSILKFSSDGTMFWVVAVPPDEACDETWVICLVYDKNYTKPSAAVPVKILLQKPSFDEVYQAMINGGLNPEKCAVPELTGKKDISAVQVLAEFIKWRQSVYPDLVFCSECCEKTAAESVNEPETEGGNSEPEAHECDEAVQKSKNGEKTDESAEDNEGPENKAKNTVTLGSIADKIKNKSASSENDGFENEAERGENKNVKK